MKPRNNRRLIVIPALIRISSHDPTPRTQHSGCNKAGDVVTSRSHRHSRQPELLAQIGTG